MFSDSVPGYLPLSIVPQFDNQVDPRTSPNFSCSLDCWIGSSGGLCLSGVLGNDHNADLNLNKMLTTSLRFSKP